MFVVALIGFPSSIGSGEKRVDCECSEPISSSEAILLLGELKRAERELIDCKPKHAKFERREPLASEAR